MFTFLLSTVGLVSVAAYGYMGVLMGWGASKAGDGYMKAAAKGATWPVTAYWVMKSMYDRKPDA